MMSSAGMFSLDSRENSDTTIADSISHYIEQCCLAFLKSLVDNGKNPSGYVTLSNPWFYIFLYGLCFPYI